MPARRPPLHICKCGSTYAAWEPRGCPKCKRRQGLGSLAREQRLARRAGDELVGDSAPAALPYGELPEGF